MVSNYPRQFGEFERKSLLCFIPFQFYISLTANLLLVEVEIQVNLQLLMRGVKQSITLDQAIWLSIILTLVRSNFDIGNEIVPEGMREIRKVLPVDADIKHIERILVIEMGYIRYFAGYDFTIIDPFRAEPI